MRRNVFCLIMIFILAFAAAYAQKAEIFGTYNDGAKDVSLDDVKLYMKVFGMRMTEINRYVPLLKSEERYEAAFKRLVVEKIISDKMEEELTLDEKVSLVGYSNKLKSIYTNEELRNSLVKEAMDISSDEIKEYYENNKDKFKDPDKMKCSMIFKELGLNASVDKKKELRAELSIILSKAKKNPDEFHELATRYSDSETAQKGGRLGWFRRDNNTLNPKFFNKVFPLKKGTVSDIIELPTGYAIIYMEDKQEEGLKPFSKISKRVENQMVKERFENLQSSLTKITSEERRKIIRKMDEYKRKWRLLNNAFMTEKYLERLIDEEGYSDSDLREYLNENRSRFDLPRKWELMGLAVGYNEDTENRIKKFYAKKDANKKAQKLMKEITEGADFDKLIVDNSDDGKSKAQSGYLGWISKIENSVFAHYLENNGVGEYVGPIHFNNAYWILRVMGIKDSKKVSVAEVREKLDKYYRHGKMKQLRVKVYNEAYEETSPRITMKMDDRN